MKAAFLQDGQVRLRTIPSPCVEAGQVRLRVDACGICGSDLHIDPQRRGQEEPFGHEVAGTIVETGSGVTGFEAGRRVVLDSATPCGRCEACRNARQELCSDIQSFFYLGSFGLAEEMIAPAASAIVCEDLPGEVACLQEPLGVAIDLVRLADLRRESNVLILGQGPIGLMALALARRAGARRVFVSDFKSRAGRARLAADFGADAYVDPSETPLEQFGFGCAVDRILVTAPPKTLPAAFQVAAKGGIVSFIGIEHGPGATCAFDANDFHFKKLQLRASFASPALFGPEALRLLREGVVDGPALVSHRFGLDQVAEALEVARTDSEAVKVVVRPQSSGTSSR